MIIDVMDLVLSQFEFLYDEVHSIAPGSSGQNTAIPAGLVLCIAHWQLFLDFRFGVAHPDPMDSISIVIMYFI